MELPKEIDRVLLVSYHFLPENVPAALHPKFFAKYLPEFGYDVHVLASSHSPFGYSFSGDRSESNVDRVPVPGPELDRMKFWHWVEGNFGNRLNIPDWGRPWISHAVAKGKELIRAHRYRYMVSFSPCFVTHRAALRLKQADPSMKWFVYAADPFVDNPFNPVNPVQLLLNRRLERKVFETADGIIANTQTVEDLWRERYPHLSDRFFHIHNGFDSGETGAGPLPIPADRKVPLLLHAGSLYGARFPKALFESIDRLSSAGKLTPQDIQVQLLGYLDSPSVSCPDLVQKLQAQGFLQLDGVVPRAEALQRIAGADYLLLIDLNEKNAKFQVPSKLFDYLQVGRPVLCYTQRGSETAAILQQSGVQCELIYTGSAPEEADRALQNFLQLPTDPTPVSQFTQQFDAKELTRFLVSQFDRGAVPKSAKPSRTVTEKALAGVPK